MQHIIITARQINTAAAPITIPAIAPPLKFFFGHTGCCPVISGAHSSSEQDKQQLCYRSNTNLCRQTNDVFSIHLLCAQSGETRSIFSSWFQSTDLVAVLVQSRQLVA
ncbi:Hypothetical_protein [Hexamita inflata]|uniref:Hypothetical_protein n=1 Tax=Hexamita inflata TaxID=28002 RepID=A0AA86QX88_9EUKA|nr:Hypothetical protein HINF_LOCUS49178 [Hexamita inflata]